MAAVDYFLQVDGIEGESSDKQFPRAIEIESFSWGVTQTGASSGGGGGGAGKAVPTDLTVLKRIDKASPKLFLACCTGQHIKTVVLSARRPNFTFLQIELSDVLVSSYQEAGTQGEAPVDQVSLNYAKIEYRYVPQAPNGAAGTPVEAAFDFKGNRVP